MSNVKWIKIVVDIFDDEKILLIESLPESDSIIVIWFKLLSLAGKINNGGVLLLNDRIAYTDEMLATIFRKDTTIVKNALKIFENLEMISIVNNTITIPNWGKHQSLDQLEKRRNYMKIYMRDRREAQADLANGKTIKEINKKISKINENKNKCKANSKTNVSSLEEEEEGELEREIDKEIYKNVVDYLNCSTGKNYKSNTKATRSLIDARIREGFSLSDFKQVIDTKTKAWKKDEKMSMFLRPNTLFGTKFESYLNEKIDKNTEDYGW